MNVSEFRISGEGLTQKQGKVKTGRSCQIKRKQAVSGLKRKEKK